MRQYVEDSNVKATLDPYVSAGPEAEWSIYYQEDQYGHRPFILTGRFEDRAKVAIPFRASSHLTPDAVAEEGYWMNSFQMMFGELGDSRHCLLCQSRVGQQCGSVFPPLYRVPKVRYLLCMG